MNAINNVADCEITARSTAIKERRIPYSKPMAKARRDGIKTMTRRVVSGRALELLDSGFSPMYVAHRDQGVCPYGYAEDILLPIEPWRALVEFDGVPPIQIPVGTPIWLDANGHAPEGFGRYRHARFMPKHLIGERDVVVSIRIESLQEISEDDAIAEGCESTAVMHEDGEDYTCMYATEAYEELWESINGTGSWAANPWVWVIEFRRLEGGAA